MTTSRQQATRALALFVFKIIVQANSVDWDFMSPACPGHQKFLETLAQDGHSAADWAGPVAAELAKIVELIKKDAPNFDNPNAGDGLTPIKRLAQAKGLAGLRDEMKTATAAAVAAYLKALSPQDVAGSDGNATNGENSDQTPDDTGYTPLSIPAVDRSALSTADRIVQNATKGAVSSAYLLIQKLDEAQKALARGAYIRRDAPIRIPAAADGALPSGTMRYVTAASAFALSIPPELATRFTFEIPIYTWDAPHPAVPKIKPHQYDPSVLRQLLWAISTGANAVAVGPTGCGKTTMLRNIAAQLGRPFFRIPVHGEMRKREMIGGFKQITTERGSETRWYDGVLTQAIAMPSIVDLDEIDRADPDLQYVAHQAYEREGLTILEDGGRFVPPHPHHAIVATANTKGRDDGENPYELRSQMSEATRDRFSFWIECSYMPADQELAQLITDVPTLDRKSADRLIKYGNLMRAAFLQGKLSTTCSYRQMMATAAYTAGLNASSDKELKAAEMEAIKTILVARIPLTSDVASAIEFGNQIYGTDWVA
jgi:cobaltochelatase CobS